MQSYSDIPSTLSLAESRQKILDNDKTLMSNHAGTSFPTANLQVGMFCMRTDQNKLYRLASTGPDVWTLLVDGAKTILYTDGIATALGYTPYNAGANSYGFVDSAYVTSVTNASSSAATTAAINAVVNAAPTSLDTLKKVATSLGNDAGFSVNVANALATKATPAQITARAGDASSIGFRNRIINGDMRIDQRFDGASVATAATVGYVVDRWQQRFMTPVGTTGRSTNAPPGFTNSLRVTITAGVAPAAGDKNYIAQAVEGFSTADMLFGTGNAQPIAVSFWVYSSVAGTYSASVQNSAGTRSYPFTFNIAAVNTWEKKTVTIPGDTAGVWLTDNGVGLYFAFDLGNGATVRGSATGAWQAGDVRGVTGGVSIVSTTGAVFQVTGVQIELGSSVTEFERIEYGNLLRQCFRYYYRYTNTVSYAAVGAFITANTGYFSFKLPVSMRATPTLASTPAGFILVNTGSGAHASGASLTAGAQFSESISIVATGTGGGATPGYGTLLQPASAASYIEASAEL